MEDFAAGYLYGRMRAVSAESARQSRLDAARRVSRALFGPRQVGRVPAAAPVERYVTLADFQAVATERDAALAERDRYRRLYQEGCAAYTELRDLYEAEMLHRNGPGAASADPF